MAYTPELSQRGSATLRRLALFRGKPMSQTLETLLEATGRTMAEIRPVRSAPNAEMIVSVTSVLSKFRMNEQTKPIVDHINTKTGYPSSGRAGIIKRGNFLGKLCKACKAWGRP